ncbi:hypothetical protein C5S39_10120 [Candidatus Methanophagaceae archaeon]|nr:hypothetical protein C5S39_10120 [Methanophagales archaeon]
MKEKIENSIELRDRIIRDEKLLRVLSEKIAEILKGKVEIGADETYTFVPLVNKRSTFAPEILAGPRAEVGPWWWCRYWPICGLPTFEFLKVIEKYRITEKTPQPGMTLREQILGNKALLQELSEAVSSALKEHGVAINEDVMYVFSPIVYKKPTFAHEMFLDVTPMVAAGPHPVPSSPVVVADHTPELGIIAASHMASESASWCIVTPIDGIPAPELLYALDRFRF